MKPKTKNQIEDYDAVLDAEYGCEGTPEREQFRREAYAFCMGQVIKEARKEENITQQELAVRIGASKGYVSRVENGLVDPTIGSFCAILSALGLRMDIVKSLA